MVPARGAPRGGAIRPDRFAAVIPPVFERHRLVITQEPALRITGRLQNVAGVIHVRAERIEALRESALPAQASHDFR